MNFEVLAMLPPEGHVIEICYRCGRLEFLIGYCRQILLFEKHVEFVDPFRRVSNAAMTTTKVEQFSVEHDAIGKYCIDFCPEQKWMTY